MVCGFSCFASVVFIITMIYFYTATYTGDVANKYMASLPNELKGKYKEIVQERAKLSYQGYAIGLIISSFFLWYHNFNKMKLSNISVVCIVMASCFFTNYFYYMLSPKKHYMLSFLKTKEEIENWLKMYRTMQFNYHTGLVFGIIGAGFLGNAFKCF